MKPKYFLVKIRRDIGKQVRPNAEQLDGKCFCFKPGYKMDDGDPYPGETAMFPSDFNYPKSAPLWIASGDLQAVRSKGGCHQ